VAYFLTSITMLDLQTSDMRQIQLYMMSASALPMASARLSKLRFLCLNDLLDGDLCKSFLYFYIFSLFTGFQTFYQMRWFYPYRSFKHSKWWCHKL